MHRQIAMLACTKDHLTPFMTAKDDFVSVLVSGLEEGGEVQVELEGVNTPFLLSSGLNHFSEQWKGRFAFRKIAGSSPSPTSVEILRGGK